MVEVEPAGKHARRFTYVQQVIIAGVERGPIIVVEREMHVLFDGWELAYEPSGSPALHLMTLLATKPADVRHTVALPAAPPDWLHGDFQVATRATVGTAWGRLVWEQRVLPTIARQQAAELLHMATRTPTLTPPIPTIVSPAESDLKEPRGLISRLRRALGAGGMSRLDAIFLPDDMPFPGGDGCIYTLPPVVHPGFNADEETVAVVPEAMNLPDTFLLYPDALGEKGLTRLMDAWSWAHTSLGDYYPLLFTGLSRGEINKVQEMVSRYGLEDSLQMMSVSNPLHLPHLYRKSEAVLQVGNIPAWGNSARNALACGKPYVAAASPQIDAIVGPAAYLAPAGDQRALGAALITVIVEESVTEQLSQAARQRSSAWDAEQFSTALGDAYHKVLSR